MDYKQYSTKELEEMLQRDFEGERPLDEDTLLAICDVLTGRRNSDTNETQAAWERFVTYYMPQQ